MYLNVFGWNLAKILTFLKSVPSNFAVCEVSYKNKKVITFTAKNVLLQYFRAEFEKDIVMFEINVLEFVKLQSLVQNRNP